MPRAGLTRDRVVAAAEEYVDEVGWEQLNLSALATRLGVRQPSLYKHTEGLDELRLRIAIRAGREITEVMARAAVGLAGRDALVAMCRAYRAWAKAHPGRYASCQRAGQPGDEWETVARAWLQVSLDVLAGFDLTGDDAIDALRALRVGAARVRQLGSARRIRHTGGCRPQFRPHGRRVRRFTDVMDGHRSGLSNCLSESWDESRLSQVLSARLRPCVPGSAGSLTPSLGCSLRPRCWRPSCARSRGRGSRRSSWPRSRGTSSWPQLVGDRRVLPAVAGAATVAAALSPC